MLVGPGRRVVSSSHGWNLVLTTAPRALRVDSDAPLTSAAPGGPRELRRGLRHPSSYLLAWNREIIEILRLAGFVMLDGRSGCLPGPSPIEQYDCLLVLDDPVSEESSAFCEGRRPSTVSSLPYLNGRTGSGWVYPEHRGNAGYIALKSGGSIMKLLAGAWSEDDLVHVLREGPRDAPRSGAAC